MKRSKKVACKVGTYEKSNNRLYTVFKANMLDVDTAEIAVLCEVPQAEQAPSSLQTSIVNAKFMPQYLRI